MKVLRIIACLTLTFNFAVVHGGLARAESVSYSVNTGHDNWLSGSPLAGDRFVNFYRQTFQGVTSLLAQTVSRTGSVISEQVLDSGPESTVFFVPNAGVLDPVSGRLNILWVKTQLGNTTTSEIETSSSSNGVQWTAKTSPVPKLIKPVGATDDWWGYDSGMLSVDGKGTLGVAVMLALDGVTDSVKPILFTTRANNRWASVKRVSAPRPRGYETHLEDLQGLNEGGFLVVFSDWTSGQGATAQFAARIKSGSTTFDSPKMILRLQLNNLRNLVKTGLNEYTYFLGVTTDDSYFEIGYLKYNSKTGNWAPFVTFPGVDRNCFGNVGHLTQTSDGARYLAYSQLCSSNQSSKIRLITISKTNSINEREIGSYQSIIDLVSFFSLPNDQFKLVYWNTQNNDPQNFDLVTSTIVGDNFGAASSLGVSITSADTSAVSIPKPFGQSMIHLDSGSNHLTRIYSPEVAPIVVAPPTVTKVAAIGKTISITGDKYFSQDSRITKRFQWFSCVNNVSTSGLTRPQDCSPISGASKSTYKVIAPNKGYFLMASVTVTNTFGSTTTYSPTSGRARVSS